MVKLSVVSTKDEMNELQSALLAEPNENNIAPFGVGEHLLKDDCGFVTLAIRNEEALVGHAICSTVRVCDDGSSMEISKLYIYEAQRRNGYANQTVDEIVSVARDDEIGEVFVQAIDQNAAKFWDKTDFEYNTVTNRYEKKLNDD
ncbi:MULTISPECIES: GNAT family N-acetyltransferase [Providencia]|uniref:GNAT family N-acetyltransferase n=1 Tax=Providencia TaxID=586 RepID=UPI0018E48263|nr:MULTISPECIES: GNAT family N-acetyltransferase [Providencia]MBI6188671.1 GNAT family N-acetyltransferase [Providencia rettgeri]